MDYDQRRQNINQDIHKIGTHLLITGVGLRIRLNCSQDKDVYYALEDRVGLLLCPVLSTKRLNRNL